MFSRLGKLLTLLLLVFAPVTGWAAENHASAKRLGDVDVSLLCPAGSAWYPIKGGACLACSDSKKPKAGVCPGWQSARWSAANYVRMRKKLSPVCGIGTFNRKGTRECWSCPKGYIRDPNLLKKFERKPQSICVSPAHPIVRKPTIAAQISLKDLLDPERLKKEVRDLGCKSYGGKATFSSFGGGTCWACPVSHPKRTLNPIFTKAACGSASCGGLDQRPCTIFERLLPCDKGTSYNPFKQQCVAKKNLVCKPIISALRSVRNGVRKANELGQSLQAGANEKIPGVKVLLALMDGVTGKLDDAASGLISKLPIDVIQADIDALFRTPDDAKDMQAVFAALAENGDKIEAKMLDPDVMCDNPNAVARLIVDIINGAKRADAGGPKFGNVMREIIGVRHAHAASDASGPRISAAFLRNRSVAFTTSASLFLKKGNIKVPVGFGLEYLIQIDGAGAISVVANFVGGLDFPSKATLSEVGEELVLSALGQGETQAAKLCRLRCSSKRAA
ncbi:MAG: hypothetical protein ACKVH0_16750 [Alphaproteobacteria bacterium]